MSDYDQLVQASRLYYELGETQNAIADRLGVTRPQVSRLLKRARAEGIVEIRIVDQAAVESPAADALRRRHGLDAVHLAPTVAGPEDLTRRMVGRLAAQVLRSRIRDGAIVGIGDGASVGAVADALEDAATPVSATIVPLAGGYWSPGPEREPFRRIADALGAQAHGLMVPGLVDDATTKHALEAHAGVRAVLDLWDRLDVALVGIGGRAWGAASVGDEVASELERAGAVGEILIAPFDIDGQFVCPALARAGARLRRAGARAGPGRDRRRGRGEQGPAGPGRAPERRDPDARDGRGHRRGRPGPRHRGRPMTDDRRTPAILGLDLGTTEVKAGLVTLEGRLLAIARAGYGLEVGHGPGWAEQDPGAWWSAVVGAVRALHPTEPVDIVAIGVDGHGPTLAAVDGRGEATRPAITFLDTRASRRGRRARRRDRDPRLGARAAARRPLAGATRTRERRADTLVPDHLGVARVPPDRRSRRAARFPTRPSRIRRSSPKRPASTWTADHRAARWAASSAP